MREQPAGNYLVNSVEEGVKLVKDFTNNALMAGRETLFFDIQRFGNNTKLVLKLIVKILSLLFHQQVQAIFI